MSDVHTAAGVLAYPRGHVALTGPALRLREAFDAQFVRWAGALGAVAYDFPPALPAATLDRVGYFQAFPHLATFPGALDADAENLRRFAGGKPVADSGAINLSALAPTADVLTPAACYHVYPTLERTTLSQSVSITTRATCFRREETFVPLERQWSFSMREIVCVGTAAEVRAFLARAAALVDEAIAPLDLPAAWRPATDPFFEPRRSGRYLMQKVAPLKTELVYADRLALASTNLHQAHFGEAFAIERDGAPAFSGCVAFGLERWVAAWLATFGATESRWQGRWPL